VAGLDSSSLCHPVDYENAIKLLRLRETLPKLCLFRAARGSRRGTSSFSLTAYAWNPPLQ
jgi:hypothetical protein